MFQDNISLMIRQTNSMGKAIFAKKNIQAKTIILTIEHSENISYRYLTQHSVLSKICNETDSKHAQFAFFLAFCELNQIIRPEEIIIKQYISQLPKYYNNLICWSEQQCGELDNRKLIDKIVKKKQDLQECFKKLRQFDYFPEEADEIEQNNHSYNRNNRSNNRYRTIKKKKDNRQEQNNIMQVLKSIDFKDFLKFYAAIQSRKVYQTSYEDPSSQVGALINILSFFNHSNDPQCEVIRQNDNYLVITKKDIQLGQQIFVKYAQNMAKEQSLEYYGMIMTEFTEEKSFLRKKTVRQGGNAQFQEIQQRRIKQERSLLAKTYNQLNSP